MFKTLGGLLVAILLAANLASAGPIKIYEWAVDVPIPDNDATGVSNTQVVADDASGLYEIQDLDVDLYINHTWQGDLVVHLSHAGVTVPLLHRAGSSANPGGFGFSAVNFGNPNIRFILNDEAERYYDAPPPNGIGDVPGIGFVGGINPDDGSNEWRPFGGKGASALSDFDGLDERGEWTLFVSDNATNDVGSIINWSLHITTVPEPTYLLFAMGLCGLAILGRRLG